MENQRIQLIKNVLGQLDLLQQDLHKMHEPLTKKYGLGVSQIRILLSLSKNPEGITTKQLAKNAHITAGAVTQLIDHLVEKKLVIRIEDNADRRISYIKVAPNAKKQFLQISNLHKKNIFQLFDDLNDNELRSLSTIVNKIKTTEE